jgi:uncharacterized membrane protein
MVAISLGLIAALAWGLHDISVRYVSQRTPVFAALLFVLVAGSAFQALAITAQNGFHSLTSDATITAIAAGVLFTSASIGLYKAFEIGPVSLVSPLIATFSILAVFWGALNGQSITLLQWLAVLAVLAGVTIVAILSSHGDEVEARTRRSAAIGWSLFSSVSFAGTLGLGQSLMETGPDLIPIFAIRIVAIAALVAVMLYLQEPLLPGRNQLPILATMGLLDAIAHGSVLTAGNLPNANYATVAASVFGMVTIILAWAILKERMTAMQWGGVAITFSGIAYLAN